MELVCIFVVLLTAAVFLADWAMKNFPESKESQIEDVAEEADKYTKGDSTSKEVDKEPKPADTKDVEMSHHTGLVIKGHRIVEGKDTTISAGDVYPIYMYTPNKDSLIWYCPVCDAENDNDATQCCVCQQPRPGKVEVVSSSHYVASSTQKSPQNKRVEDVAQQTQYTSAATAKTIIESTSEKVSVKKTSKKKWPIWCAIAGVILCIDLVYSQAIANDIKPSDVLNSVFHTNVTIDDTSYSIINTKNLTDKIISTQDEINDIGKLKNLTELAFMWSGQADVDLSALANLTQLTKLSISCSNASVVSFDFLSELTNLQELSLTSTGFKQFSTISGLTQLTSLDLSNNGITREINWGAFLSLNNLKVLDLSNNNITDCTFLRHLTNLKELNLTGNKIENVSLIANCSKLQTLRIDSITDFGTIQSLPNLNLLKLSDDRYYYGKEEINAYVKTLIESDETVKEATSTATELISLFENGQYDEIYSRQNDIYAIAGNFTCKDHTLTLFKGKTITIPVDIPDGNMLVVKKDSYIYYGEYEDTRKTGNGTQVENGNQPKYYTGEWANNYPNGYGMACNTTNSGQVYYVSGNFTNGFENGLMTLTDYSRGYKASGQYTAVNGTYKALGNTADGQYIYVYMDDGYYWYRGTLSTSAICR